MPFNIDKLGLKLTSQTEAGNDNEIVSIESNQPAGTRMLVTLWFPQGTPGVGVLADLADAAAKAVVGLSPWPEWSRVVTADPEWPGFHITYLRRGSVAEAGVAPALAPILWLLIIAAITAIILFPDIIVRVVSTVSPKAAQTIEMVAVAVPLFLGLTMLNLVKSISE